MDLISSCSQHRDFLGTWWYTVNQRFFLASSREVAEETHTQGEDEENPVSSARTHERRDRTGENGRGCAEAREKPDVACSPAR